MRRLNGSQRALPKYNHDRNHMTHTYRYVYAHRIVLGYVADEAVKHVCVAITILHCPVKMDLDALPK